MEIRTPEQIANDEFRNVPDDGLFPNHSDKDIWIAGFKAGYGHKKELDDFYFEVGEDWHLWDESEKGPYPADRILSALRNFIQHKSRP